MEKSNDLQNSVETNSTNSNESKKNTKDDNPITNPEKPETKESSQPEVKTEVPSVNEPKENNRTNINNTNIVQEEKDKEKCNNNIVPEIPQKEEDPTQDKPTTEEKKESKLNPREEDKEKSEEILKEEENNTKEKNKEEYSFPIRNNNHKLEESKNPEIGFNVGSLNLQIPEKLRPKNKEAKTRQKIYRTFQNHNRQFFNPITFSCSMNTHSNNKYKKKPIEKEEEFLEKIIKIRDTSNINEFWEVFQHLKKPNQCPIGSDYHIFKKGINPMWEDKSNKDGGKLSVLLTWKLANVIWEEVTFNFAKGILPYYDFINGIVISMRPKFLVLSFWIKSGNSPMVDKIRNALSNLLQAPSSNCFDFIPFN